MRTMRRSRVVIFLALVALGAAAATAWLLGDFGFGEPDPTALAYDVRTGSRFLPLPDKPFQAPTTREIRAPDFVGANAVWGATGRDAAGGIWIGASSWSGGPTSARLMHYDPVQGTWHDRGAVDDQLKAAGRYRDGERQNKIHSKIIPADDGWLYFASTDEAGENPMTGQPPRWGSHLWRIHPRTFRWQHLLALPEGLVAASGVGRHVFALGYFGHVLYRYDTLTGEHRRVVVGSVDGHVSRNFFADANGHAFVPRLRRLADGTVQAELVEYDSELRELKATPLEDYLGGESPQSHHGITGLAYLADGRMVFTTHRGQLYVIEPTDKGPANVRLAGWFHPGGEAYAPSLFSFSGGELLAGVTQRGKQFEWVVFELATGIAGAFPLDTKGLKNVLLYGSMARDEAGRFYVGGWTSRDGGEKPLVMQITPAQKDRG
jgi:hypothetical protein